jgi:hypothetical protein
MKTSPPALVASLLLGALNFVAPSAFAADASSTAFVPDAEIGHFRFDTGALRGRVRLNGKSQGIVELVHAASGTAVAQGGGLPGLFSLYRVFSTGARHGDAARDWPTESRVLADGALETRWPPAPDHPLAIATILRWARADTLDLAITVTPQRALARFELFVSSYFPAGFDASVYVKPNFFNTGKPEFLRADVNPMVDGSYLMFPRDREAVLMIFDRRWDIPPHPVQWSVTRWLAEPVALRRDARSGVTALLMSLPQDCFAMATPYNKTPPDGVAAHHSLYFSLFGQDLAAGQSATSRVRLVVGQDLDDAAAVARYRDYVADRRPQNPSP